MNISKAEQRALHALAQGGQIALEREGGAVVAYRLFNRDGWQMDGFDLLLFRKLKRRRFIASKAGGPYGITRGGLLAVRAQLDNR